MEVAPSPEAVETPSIDETPGETTVLAALPPAKPAGLVAPAETAAPVVAVAPEPEVETETVAPAAATGWMVQLTSQRSEAQAKDAFSGLKQQYAGILGNASPAIARADLGNRGIFYRVRVVAGSRGEADRMCGALKAQGGDCFVQYVN